MPFVVTLREGQPEIFPLQGDRLEERVDAGRRMLEEPADGTEAAVLVYDSVVDYEESKRDSMLVDARKYNDQPASFTMAIAYTAADDSTPFSVARPEFLGFDGCEESVLATLVDPFFEGVETHPQGASVWNAHMDRGRDETE